MTTTLSKISIHPVLIVALAVGASGCIPVRTTNLEGAGRMQIRSYDDKAALQRRFGLADAMTADGRFVLYSLRKEAEWYVIGPGGNGSSPALAEVDVGLTHVLIEFDGTNAAGATRFHHCGDGTDDAICRESAEDIMWSMIGSLHGAEVAADWRETDTTHAALAADMHAAARAGDVARIDELLRRGASLSAHSGGMTPLHRAAQHGQTRTINHLLDLGAPVEVLATPAGRTPLHFAAENGHLRTIKLLLSRGAKLEAADGNGLTPLRVAAGAGQTAAAIELIAVGADVNAEPNDTLIQAARTGQPELVTALIVAGAELDARVNLLNGRSALGYAVEFGHYEIATLLLDRGA
jgi:hypothetical protein